MRIVLGTNVAVSGFLNPHGIPGQLLYRVTQGEVTLLIDVRILEEYRVVLERSEFELPAEAVHAFLAQVREEGQIVIPPPLRVRLQDQDDEPFLEVALEGKADALVTGNKRHYPASACQGLRVLSPAEFQDLLRKR